MPEVGIRVRAEKWVVARCANLATLLLMAEFQDEGIRCWAPKMVCMKRLPHTRKPQPVTSALLPGFVFVDSADYDKAEALYESGKKSSGFAWFLFLGQRVYIMDDELDGLRFVEDEMSTYGDKPPEPNTFEIGSSVKVIEGPFQNMVGKIKAWDGNYYSIDFPGFPGFFKVTPFLLIESQA